jgi:hypothetical protein
MDEQSRRNVNRTPTTGQIVGEVMVFQPMITLDLSEKGAQIETAFALHNDSLHDFRLSLDDRSVVVKARVVYCQIGELKDGSVLYRSGIEFVEPSPHVLAAIREFVRVHNLPPPRVIDAELA